MVGSSGGGQQVQSTSTAPWSGVQGALTTGIEKAGENLQNPQQYFPGSTVVPFSPQTETALQATENRALAGSPLTAGAQDITQRTMGGEYLQGGNPAYQGMVERSIAPMRSEFENVIMPATQSQFAAAGRYGSPGGLGAATERAGDQYMRQVGDVTSGLAYKNYGDERTRQMQSTALAPELAAGDYQDISMLGQAGGAREGQAQAELQGDISRFNFGQQQPTQALADYMALIGGGSMGGQQTTQTTGGGGFNPVLGALGAGATTTGILGDLYGGANPLFKKPSWMGGS